MSFVEFQSWTPDRNADRRWQLINGALVCMVPASENHGSIQAEASFLLTSHLRSSRAGCRVVMAPGIIPPVSATKNLRIPDLGVTCAPATGSQAMQDPLVLIEILSPSNAAITRDNVWAYTTIPTVMEILLLGSLAVSAELLRRDPDGSWPEEPLPIGARDQVVLHSVEFSAPLVYFYRTTNLISS